MNTIILEKSMIDLEGKYLPVELIREAINKIPYINKLNNITVRRSLFEKCGSAAFLYPEELKYPIINPDDFEAMESITPDCNLLLRAYYELKLESLSESKDLIEKANFLIQSCSCEREKIGVHLEGFEEIIELDTLLYYFCNDE